MEHQELGCMGMSPATRAREPFKALQNLGAELCALFRLPYAGIGLDLPWHHKVAAALYSLYFRPLIAIGIDMVVCSTLAIRITPSHRD